MLINVVYLYNTYDAEAYIRDKISKLTFDVNK